MLDDQLRQKIIEIYPTEIKQSKSLLLFENIPSKKLNKATKNYAKIGNDETVIILFDETVFGSAKLGFLLTSKRLYRKNTLERADSVEIDEIIGLSLDTFSPTYPEIHVEARLKTLVIKAVVGKDNIETKFSFLKNTIELLQGKKLAAVGDTIGENAATTIDNVPQQTRNCISCGAPGQSNKCEYCGSALQ